ncbi:hypothetical protein [Vibrio alginolyticus]|uniref:hypothetical protein n=1 Tax=Vibrio alginolyticus TaxID=663 RepID=UPI0011EEA290|nr:hypothetical protein [Vibrio alginolyticus]TYZ36865.1 hypothetical protein EWT61_10245 [Vibrio alginolyticus]
MASDVQLFASINNDPEAQLELNKLTADKVKLTESDFLELVHSELDTYIQYLENHAEFYTDASEDAITHAIASMFMATKKFKSSTQTYAGGAVDLTVQLDSHVWRAEAKIDTHENKVFEGLLQLLTRYSKRDTNKGMLIYVKTGSFKNKVTKWRDFVSNPLKWSTYTNKNKLPQHKAAIEEIFTTLKLNENINHATFDFSVELDNGLDVKIRNYFVDLKFLPSDSSGNSGKKHALNFAINELLEIGEQDRQGEPLDTTRLIQALNSLHLSKLPSTKKIPHK